MLHALVAENCNNPGTSTFSLAGAMPGCVAFSVRFTDGQPVFYLATDGASPPNYEAGIGTYHATTVPATISRDTVTENSSRTTAKISFPGAIQVINFMASDRAVYVDNVGNAHINGNAVVSGDAYVNGNLRMNTNGMSLFAQDTGNVTRQVFIPLTNQNHTDIFIAGGASSPPGRFQIINQANTTPLFTLDNTGNAAISGALTVGGAASITGALTMGGGILLDNNTAIQAKDAGGVARSMIFIDTQNNLDVFVPNAAKTFRVLNQAGTVSLFQVDNNGVAIVTGTLQVTSAATLGGAVSIAGSVSLSASQTITGTAPVNVFGWELYGGGTQSISGTTRGVSLYCPNGAVLANTVDANSDRRLKSDIQDIAASDGEAFIRSARPSLYLLNGNRQSGFIAQDLILAGYGHMVGTYSKPGLPELIDGALVSKADVQFTLSYNDTIPYLAAAMKSILVRIDALES